MQPQDSGSIVVVNPIYEARAVFSINAANQLQGTIWGTKDGVHFLSPLGPASYLVRDKDGNLVSGLSETGLIADANGLYAITPVSASSLNDLTHYVVELVVTMDGSTKKGVVGISWEG